MYKFDMPNSLSNDTKSLKLLISIYDNIKDLKYSKIVVDFRSTEYVAPNIFAILGLIFNYGINNNNSIEFKITGQLVKIFSNIGFLGSDIFISEENQYIRFKEFIIKGPEEFANFLDVSSKEIFTKDDKKQYVKGFKKTLVECFSNVKNHTFSETLIMSGGINKEYKTVSVSICNFGTTILENYNNRYPDEKFQDDTEAIEWAIKRHNTTKVSNVGGLGLFMAHLFIKKASGELWIVSGKGYLHIDFRGPNLKKETHTFEQNFNGTIITIDVPNQSPLNFNLDLNKYLEISEIIDIIKEDTLPMLESRKLI